MKKRKLIDLILIVLPVAAIILTALPNAVMLRFATPDKSYYQYFSGFDMVPPGYAVWGPMLAGVSAIVLTILGTVNAFKSGKSLKKWILGVAVFGMVMSISPVLLGTLTVVGGIVAVLLASEAALIYYIKNK